LGNEVATEWQGRPLDPGYAAVHLDALRIKGKQDGKTI
jgi:transposase-like protein